MKGLLPDEEKEKIGPKNVISGSRTGNKLTAAVISAKPQANPNPMVSASIILKPFFF